MEQNALKHLEVAFLAFLISLTSIFYQKLHNNKPTNHCGKKA